MTSCPTCTSKACAVARKLALMWKLTPRCIGRASQQRLVRPPERLCTHDLLEDYDCGCSFRCLPGMPCEASWQCCQCRKLFRDRHKPAHAEVLNYNDPRRQQWAAARSKGTT